MATNEPHPEPAGIKLDDILFLIRLHKWKLILGIFLGLAAAGATYFTYVPEYESEAKLLVRYVVDKSAVDPGDAQQRPGGAYGDTLLAAELEILTSWDLIQEVAEEAVADKTVSTAGRTATVAEAAGIVQSGLHVLSSPTKGNVITVTFRNRDPEVARSLLKKIVNTYFEKHLQAHRSDGSFGVVRKQTDDLKARLSRTEGDLKRKRDEAGITSAEKASGNLEERVLALQAEADAAELQRAEQLARIAAIKKTMQAQDSESVDKGHTEVAPVSEEDLDRYHELLEQRASLRKTQTNLGNQYTNESRVVLLNRREIAETESELRKLEKRSPGLLTAQATMSGLPASDARVELANEQLKLVGIEARTEALKAQMEVILAKRKKFADAETEIVQLERSKAADEKNLQYFQLSLEKARVDETLDPSKMPNISVVQNPSPAMKMSRNIRKALTGIIGGGVGLGVLMVLVTEFVLDPSVKRATELQARMGIPLLQSIPRARLEAGPKVVRDLAVRDGEGRPHDLLPDFPKRTELKSHLESVRDRLILSFELNNLFHTPKLVAVTGCSAGAGTSSIAGGLAAALAETGDGKVLLVDMNRAQSDHPLFNGKPISTVTEALRTGNTIASVSDNLYLATVGAQDGGPVQLVPRRFYEMVPHFKASMYDYIVFDMPPLDESCAALAIAGSVDKVLLVVEAGGTHREVVRRAYGDLVGAKANVSCILNKVDPSGPDLLKRAS